MRHYVVDFSAGKNNFFFYQFHNSGAIDVKIDRSVLEEKEYLRN